MQRARARFLAGLAIVALSGPAAAQQPTTAQQNAIRQNCRADFQAHCAGVTPGGSAALSCLQQNAAVVSAPCQQALSAIGGGAAPPAQSPAAPPVTGGAPPPSQGGSAPVPRPAPPPLSPRQQAYILRQACGIDFQQFCRGVPLGGGRAIGCLASHRTELSPRCQGALTSARQ